MNLGPQRALALTARISYLESLYKGVAGVVHACAEGARLLASQSAEPALYMRRRDLVLDLPPLLGHWQQGLEQRLKEATQAIRQGRPIDLRVVSHPAVPMDDSGLSLLDDSAMERDLTAHRLGQAVSDLTGSEYTDLSSRLQAVSGTGLLDQPDASTDVLSPQTLARWVLDSWLGAGLDDAHWVTLQTVLQNEVAHWAHEALHHANRVLLDHGVRPEIDLRPFIRRAKDTGIGPLQGARGGAAPTAPSTLPPTLPGGLSRRDGPAGAGGVGLGGHGAGTGTGTGASAGGSAGGWGGRPGAGSGGAGAGAGAAGVGTGEAGSGSAGGGLGGDLGAGGSPGSSASSYGASGRGALASDSGLQPLGGAHDETRLLTQTPGMHRLAAQSQAVLGKLNQVVSRQVPDFDPAALVHSIGSGHAISASLGRAMRDAQQVVRRHVDSGMGVPTGSPQALLQDLNQAKRSLKQAASTPVERATIEIVALLFQSILTEERLPATIRVWFARLQMPVLRVAVGEPDFFATISHPARALIDRMGACVMGFAVGPREDDQTLHKEIKRIVQVVEAYPDTGRRVFQTVLTEFEKFLEHYFRDQNEASRKGVSLAQQVEQRETWAIQYTIELRKMLNDVPVHEGVREFLFHVWADVLAHSAVQTNPASEETRVLKRAAADLIWSASAKTSREERADVLRRLPPLLKKVRDGMARAGLSQERQDEHIHALNAALAAAFSARSAAISSARLQEVTERLESLDEILPNLADVELDEQTLRDLSGHESDDLEVVAEGGTMPTPAMMGWARELQVGSWFKLDYRGRQEAVQLAWHGLQKQLALFVTPAGRGVLFQLHRVAAFLQAGLLVPAEEESLTTRATRQALAKLDADPQRLLN